MQFPAALTTRFRMPAPNTSEARALALFRRIATPLEYEELIQKGGVMVLGEYATYVVLQNGASYVVNEGGDVLASGCLVLMTEDYYSHFPVLDHVIAVYLVLKSDERYYWNTACISVRHPDFVSPKARINQDWFEREATRGAKREPTRGFLTRLFKG